MAIDQQPIINIKKSLEQIEKIGKIPAKEEDNINAKLAEIYKNIDSVRAEAVAAATKGNGTPPPPPPPFPSGKEVSKTKLDVLLEKAEKEGLSENDLSEIIIEAKKLRGKMIQNKSDKELFQELLGKKKQAGFWKIFIVPAYDENDKDYQSFRSQFEGYRRYITSQGYYELSLKDRNEARKSQMNTLKTWLDKLMKKGQNKLDQLSKGVDVAGATAKAKEVIKLEKERAEKEREAEEERKRKYEAEKEKRLEKTLAGKIIKFLNNEKNKPKFGKLKMKSPREGFIDMLKDFDEKKWNDEESLEKNLNGASIKWEDIFPNG